MTTDGAPRASESAGAAARPRGPQAVMTAQLAARQFGLLFLAGTALLFCTFFINYNNVLTFTDLWGPRLDFRYFTLPALLVAVYGYVLLNGVLFALGPSERSFNFFFGSMVLALLVVNYDHSIVDWFLKLFAPIRFRFENPVSLPKVVFGGLFLFVVILMHYNVLSDDFARRMIRRGVPTEEAFRIRPGMFKILVPTVFTAIAAAAALAAVGEFSALVFQRGGLFLPKLQLVLLAALVVPIAFLIRGILRDMGGGAAKPPAGPNR